ncbi:MAG: 1-acyl-sn-glycerol-3-phosphate acyltransferase [Hellea sp.]|nr:1-acyl-sn-glycerol-3-phosphate acyltransferase [Hellea sp.]
MRSFLFNIFFLTVTIVYAFVAVIFSLVPGRWLMMGSLRRYTRLMVWAMRVIAGIKVQAAGQARVPDGPVIIASKHQSYGDGFVIFSQFDDLSFVTGDHITKFLFVKRILAKMNAVVIDSCGGEKVREKMTETARIIREQGRRILIFPEGHLSEIGTHHRYRKGVWHLYHDFDCPVVPVASNLGQRWNQMDIQKFPGTATVEFLEPIQPGMDKDEFMALLQDRIETRSIELLDMENLGALNPENIGKLSENDSAREKRQSRDAEEKVSS